MPVIFCKAGERKHRIAEAYLATHTVGVGVFLVLVAKAPAPVWKVKRSAAGHIVNIERRREYVNHCSFHIIAPEWGHVTIKMSGHPPFGVQIMLNGHEFVDWPRSQMPCRRMRLGQVCRRWIYTACLCFGLDLDEQHRSGFGYGFAVYQLDEYSRNLIFVDGKTMQQVFDAVVDRTRSRLDVPKVRTIFGAMQRPRRTRKRSSTIEAAIETPTYDLTVFKLHFGRLTGKAYTKGERVLRFEATQRAGIADRFVTALDCVDTGFIADGVLDALRAALALAPAPNGFTVSEFAAKVHAMTGRTDADYTICQAAYDLRKPAHWTRVDRDYEQIRINMQTLFDDLALATPAPLAA